MTNTRSPMTTAKPVPSEWVSALAAVKCPIAFQPERVCETQTSTITGRRV